MDTKDLAKKIRLHAIRMVNKGGSSHIASVLSMSDILSVLYGSVMKYNPEEPKWNERDRFILSKGHAGAGVYAVLAESGFFSTDLLDTHYQDGSIFSGHVSHRGVAGVELSTGSLGHGLPVGAGIAYAAKIDGNTYRVFVVMGDGELGEGSNWEALLFSSHHNLDNLVAIIDRNKLQSMKTTEETLALEPLKKKFESFGWQVSNIDGHSHTELLKVLTKRYKKPHIIIADTVKGKGVSYMENQVAWHYKTPKDELYIQAINELMGDV